MIFRRAHRVSLPAASMDMSEPEEVTAMPMSRVQLQPGIPLNQFLHRLDTEAQWEAALCRILSHLARPTR